MTIRHFNYAILIIACFFLLLIISCAENKVVQKPSKVSPPENKICRLSIITLQTHLKSLSNAVSRYEKTQTSARKAIKTRPTDMSSLYTRLHDDATDIQRKIEPVKQEWARFNGMCPVNNLGKQSRKEVKSVAAVMKRLSKSMNNLDCTFCNNLNIIPVNSHNDPNLFYCLSKAGHPDKCAQTNIEACKSCCNNLNPADTSSSYGNRENCIKECSNISWNCKTITCKNTNQCRQKVSPSNCDSQECQTCCSANCPDGIDSCTTDCAIAKTNCIFQKIANDVNKSISTLLVF
jgi:hypothetical protein